MTTTQLRPVTIAPALAPTPAEVAAAPEDVRGWLLIHRALRRELRRLREAVEDLPDGDLDGALRLAERFRVYEMVIEGHHTAEDAVAFPEIVERAPELVAVLERLTAEHHELDARGERVRDALALLAPRTDAEHRAEASEAISAFETFLDAHLAVEESQIIPTFVERFTPAEREASAKRVLKAEDKKALAWGAPMVVAACNAEEEAALWAGAPGILKVLYRLSWRRRYERLFG